MNRAEETDNAAPRVSLYLDVDGVVCPFGAADNTPWGSLWNYAFAGMLEVAYAPELVGALNGLAQVPGLRCVWLTSWGDLAPGVLCPAAGIQGTGWPVLTAGGAGSGPDWWKLEALQADLEASGTERIIWADDQLAFERQAQAWARIIGGRALLISPDPRRGLTPLDVEAMRAFTELQV
jgi:hypothetical protein